MIICPTKLTLRANQLFPSKASNSSMGSLT